MARGTLLNKNEKQKITKLHNKGFSNQQIAIDIGRSLSCINNFIKTKKNENPEIEKNKNKGLSARSKHAIFRAATIKNLTSSEIKDTLELPITTRHIQQILHKSNHAKWGKQHKKIFLKKHHKVARIQFAETYLLNNSIWSNTIFTDEKHFNLDGPDGVQYHWYNPQNLQELFSKRNFQGSSIMVWGGFSSKGKINIKLISKKINSLYYIHLLENIYYENILPLHRNNFYFLQDNARVHTSTQTLSWFNSKNILLIKFPPLSPDLNPMENLWGILVRVVYKGGRHYSSIESLKEAISHAWENDIKESFLKSLVESVPHRLIEVLKCNGNIIKF